jgi:hypothetical protein
MFRRRPLTAAFTQSRHLYWLTFNAVWQHTKRCRVSPTVGKIAHCMKTYLRFYAKNASSINDIKGTFYHQVLRSLRQSGKFFTSSYVILSVQNCRSGIVKYFIVKVLAHILSGCTCPSVRTSVGEKFLRYWTILFWNSLWDTDTQNSVILILAHTDLTINSTSPKTISGYFSYTISRQSSWTGCTDA